MNSHLTSAAILLLTCTTARATVMVFAGQSLTLDGPAQSMSSTNDSTIGRAPPLGTATLSILNGATLGSAASGVGSNDFNLSGVEGRVFIDGAGSRWLNTERVIVGLNAVGRINVVNGGYMSASSDTSDPAMWVGIRSASSVPSHGEVTVQGAVSELLLNGQLGMGYGSNAVGTLLVFNGGSVNSRLSAPNSIHSAILGYYTGKGHAVVDGPGSIWTHTGRLALGISTSQSLAIGDPRGDLVVSNGGEVRAESIVFGGTSHIDPAVPGTGVGTAAGGRIVSDTLLSVGRGSLNIQAGGEVVAGRLGIAGSGTVFFNDGRLDAGDIGLSGGRLLMSATEPLLLRARTLSYPVLNQFGRIDLGIGGAAFNYTGATDLVAINTEVVRGRSNGTWNGHGITSSVAAADPTRYAVGIAEASETGLTSLFGESFDNTTVIVRYTLLGDATLDGTVNISDFANLAANFNQSGRWFTGDFDYSGTTNIADFALLAQNFNQSLPASRSTVPEPAVAVGVLFVIASLRSRAV